MSPKVTHCVIFEPYGHKIVQLKHAEKPQKLITETGNFGFNKHSSTDVYSFSDCASYDESQELR